MVAPPFEAGAVKLTVADPFPGVAVPIVGAPGADAGATFETLQASVHLTVVPLTVIVFCVPEGNFMYIVYVFPGIILPELKYIIKFTLAPLRIVTFWFKP